MGPVQRSLPGGVERKGKSMDSNHYERAEDTATRCELAGPSARAELAVDAQLAQVYATLAVADQLALLRAAVERQSPAGSYTQLIHGHRPVEDVPLPAGDGSCSECGTPDLLGHKLNCSKVRG